MMLVSGIHQNTITWDLAPSAYIHANYIFNIHMSTCTDQFIYDYHNCVHYYLYATDSIQL